VKIRLPQNCPDSRQWDLSIRPKTVLPSQINLEARKVDGASRKRIVERLPGTSIPVPSVSSSSELFFECCCGHGMVIDEHARLTLCPTLDMYDSQCKKNQQSKYIVIKAVLDVVP
jgi:hypothetical protein